jgi:peroxiredoxin
MTLILAGHIAPGFSLKGLDGKTYSLEALMERGPVLAAFFKISCPVCQFTFPFLERMFKLYGGRKVTFLGISQDDARDTKKFADEFGVTFPMAMDEGGYLISSAYGLTNVPTIFLIDTEGVVKISTTGFVRADLESMASELATACQLAPAALFRPQDDVPELRPG